MWYSLTPSGWEPNVEPVDQETADMVVRYFLDALNALERPAAPDPAPTNTSLTPLEKVRLMKYAARLGE